MAAQNRPDVERLRTRLNTLVLVVPGQFLPLVAGYWLRFVPPFRPCAFEVPTPRPEVFLACAASTPATVSSAIAALATSTSPAPS